MKITTVDVNGCKTVRDMTNQEIAQWQASQIEIEEPTTIDDLVEAIDILTNIVLGGAE